MYVWKCVSFHFLKQFSRFTSRATGFIVIQERTLFHNATKNLSTINKISLENNVKQVVCSFFLRLQSDKYWHWLSILTLSSLGLGLCYTNGKESGADVKNFYNIMMIIRTLSSLTMYVVNITPVHSLQTIGIALFYKSLT